METLHGNTGVLKTSVRTLDEAVRKLHGGTQKLADGTTEFADKTANMDMQIRDQIDAVLTSHRRSIVLRRLLNNKKSELFPIRKKFGFCLSYVDFCGVRPSGRTPFLFCLSSSGS